MTSCLARERAPPAPAPALGRRQNAKNENNGEKSPRFRIVKLNGLDRPALVDYPRRFISTILAVLKLINLTRVD
ncbi:hypothetical protein T07_5789 [Trichinella nelsoni]|uniref:Uncharacterized protein n=1 Tax=Trichinella nelsoni TaxID=6336 RepID=A0A0V0SCU2_9BILA|nr:hypothetical protein T07_5789 [Trichinella nelsoni]